MHLKAKLLSWVFIQKMSVIAKMLHAWKSWTLGELQLETEMLK